MTTRALPTIQEVLEFLACYLGAIAIAAAYTLLIAYITGVARAHDMPGVSPSMQLW